MKNLEGLALFQARESLVKMQSLCSNMLMHGCKSYAQAVKLRDLVAQFKVFGSFPVEHLASLDCWFVREARSMTERDQKRVAACGLPQRDEKLVVFGLSDIGKHELLAISAWITKQLDTIDARRQVERQDSLRFASAFLEEKGFAVSDIPLKSPKLGIRGGKESFRVEIFSLLGAELRSWSFVEARWRADIHSHYWHWVVRYWRPQPAVFGHKIHYAAHPDFGHAHADFNARGLAHAFYAACVKWELAQC